MKNLSLTKILPIVFFTLLSQTSFAASYEDQIVQTVSNGYSPAGQEIAIKDVDLHRIDFGNESFTSTSYLLSVYVYVKSDLGELSSAINLVDVNDQALKPLSGGGDNVATKAGFDQATGYYVYLLKMPVDPNAAHASALYAVVNENDVLHYSNEGFPNTFFAVNANEQ